MNLSLALLAFAVGVGADSSAAPDFFPVQSDQERLALLETLGLNAEAERQLRFRVDAGDTLSRGDYLRLLVREGRAAQAAPLAEEWSPLADPIASFLIGRIRDDLRDFEGAAEAYSASAAHEPLLADHASYLAGTALERLGRSEEALGAYEAAGASARTQSLASRAWWRAAGLAYRTGFPDRALENLERIPSRSVIARDDLLDLEISVWRAQGNREREARALRELLDRVPSSDQAIAAMDRLAELEPPTVDDRLSFADAALRNRHGALAEQEARKALEAVADGKDPVREGKARLAIGKSKSMRRQYTAAREELARIPAGARIEERTEGALEAARCLWRVGQIDACLAEYDRVVDSNAPAEYRATAAWEAGREAKDNRRWEEAVLRLREFAERFPKHDRADDALWHAGRALGELGRAEEAIATFHLLCDRYPDSSFHEEGTYWIVNLYHEAGNDSLACVETRRLALEHPDGWWTNRARQRASECPVEADPAIASRDPFDWLASVLPEIDASRARELRRSVRESEPYRRAEALASLGLIPEAENELSGLMRGLDRDTPALVAFAEAAWVAGVPRSAMRAASVIKARTGRGILSGETPFAVARLLYPVDHLDSVLKWSNEYGIDPLFVLAVMREESWFDASAVSWAGAHGLLQIMPSTGRDLARRTGLRNFEQSDLFDPDTNIRLGAFYLKSLLNELDSEPTMALSAYNAGKGNALRWKKGLDGEFDVDRYVAGITYRETYDYVQKVGRTWAIYRALWGDLLPRLATEEPTTR
ncbi:MAG: transglycosylase SLT domain-containing protein [Gemmatimonadetes bacterium]|nr:transglycosylase SLT domain-containing protein [Gemmatimonadota bacterium]